MTNNFLIIKTGSTYLSLAKHKGDFEDWIIAGLGIDPARVQIVDIGRGAALPRPADVAGVVITGSHAMVTEMRPWSESAAAWLRSAVEADTPVLGICYGHQLLAHAFGGQVTANPRGRDFGTVEFILSAGARGDPLLGRLHYPLRVQMCHNQSVVRLPQDARSLGSSSGDPHPAFAIGERAWGVQFHPEFDAAVLRTYVKHYWPKLQAEGKDPDKILAGIQETPVGSEILQRFAALVGNFVSRPPL